MKSISYHLNSCKGFFYNLIKIEICHYTECHRTAKRTTTGKDQEAISILQGNGVKSYELKIISLKILNIKTCLSFQRQRCDMQLVFNGANI